MFHSFWDWAIVWLSAKSAWRLKPIFHFEKWDISIWNFQSLLGFLKSCGDIPWFWMIVLVVKSIELCFRQSKNLLTKEDKNKKNNNSLNLGQIFKILAYFSQRLNIRILRWQRKIRWDKVSLYQQTQIALFTSILKCRPYIGSCEKIKVSLILWFRLSIYRRLFPCFQNRVFPKS